MKSFYALLRRNTLLFFKDRGMFFTALITPMILIVLFITFLADVYRDSFRSCIPQGIQVPDALVEGFVGGWLFSSLLAVCCVTVAFCANMIMIQDKVTGARRDLCIAPVSGSVLGLGYYFSTVSITLLICLAALGASAVYLAVVGWYLSLADFMWILLDVLLLVLFGTALSSVVCFPLSTQGQMSAVGTIVSAGYGFICGAYMPVSQFSAGIQRFISFLPGTYGTGLMHQHFMHGVFAQLEGLSFPKQALEALQTAFDCRLQFFSHVLTPASMYLVLGVSVAVLICIYLLQNWYAGKKKISLL